MNAEFIKIWLEQNVPAKARRLVVTYALQAHILEQMKQEALRNGVSAQVLEMAKAAVPMVSAQLFGTDERP